MGGNALKNLTSKRLNREEYFSLANEIKKKVRFLWPKAKVDLVPAFRNKASFGDLDIAISMSNLAQIDITHTLIKQGKAFQSNESVRNNNVLSFDHDGFQVDLIFFPEASYEYSLQYYSWNDAGNLLSRVADSMGLKLRHNGLYHQVREGSNLVSDTLVSDEFDVVLDALGYDVTRYHAGFDTLEEIIEYVASGRYFNKSAFSPDSFNAKQRRKYRLRPTFKAMVDYASALPDNHQENTVHLDRILSRFTAELA